MILIDNPDKNGWCHLVGSTIDELHLFAEKLGVNKCWYQNKRGKKQPHYDVKKERIEEAVRLGAKHVKRKELLIFLKENYK